LTVDIVVDHFSELQWSGTGPNNVPNIGDGALAWCKLDDILAIQTELGGDWIPYLQAGAFYSAPVVPISTPFANGASQDVVVNFPPGKFTQSPEIISLTTNSTRLSVAVKPGSQYTTKDQVTIRVTNFSGGVMQDPSPWVRVIALQQFV
jgi:hypothetical protein